MRIAFLATPRMSLFTFLLALEPLKAAQRLSHVPQFSLDILSLDGLPVRASNGMVVQVDGPAARDRFHDLAIVTASYEQTAGYKQALFAWLRALDRKGAALGALDHAVWFLAEAGLLERHRVAVARELHSAFAERFPHLEAVSSLYSIDGRRLTCGGHVASLDLMFEIIEQACGGEVVDAVMSELLCSRRRHGEDRQTEPPAISRWEDHPVLSRALRTMQDNLEAPLPLADVAASAGVSLRQLQHIAARSDARTPQAQYLEIRFLQARELLIYTDMPVAEVGLACGFSSPAVFARAFGKRFLTAPLRYRQAFRLRMQRPYVRQS